jgi:adhesin transport system membrane fusion protein
MKQRRNFVLFMASFIVAFITWACIAEVDVIVRTQGRIIPAGKSQIIQHLEGGIVIKINVTEGQKVSAGEALFELSDIQAKSSLGRERSNLDALRGKEARLEAESLGLNSIRFPPDLNDSEIQHTELSAFTARRSHAAEQIRVLRNQSAQKRGEINEAENRRRSLQAELDLARQQFKVIEDLNRQKAASQLELLESKQRIQKLNSEISEAQSVIPRLQSAASEIDAKVSEILAGFRSQASSELSQVRADIEKSSSTMQSDTDRLKRNVVRAPVTGIVNRLSVSTIGGVVKPGEALMEITPMDAGIFIEAKAQPNDRANLHPGLKTHIQIGAYDAASYGTLEGKVSEGSADSIQDEREGRYYRVMISASLSQSKELKIVPGMTAISDIVVGKRTIMSYIVSPILRFQKLALRDPR